MPGKRHTAEGIVNKLREADVELAQGASIAQTCRKIGITDQTYYRWCKEYGGLKVDQARRFKEIEKENTRLKRVVADQALDLAILKEVAEGNFFYEASVPVNTKCAAEVPILLSEHLGLHDPIAQVGGSSRWGCPI
jgi:transposase-like protein